MHLTAQSPTASLVHTLPSVLYNIASQNTCIRHVNIVVSAAIAEQQDTGRYRDRPGTLPRVFFALSSSSLPISSNTILSRFISGIPFWNLAFVSFSADFATVGKRRFSKSSHLRRAAEARPPFHSLSPEQASPQNGPKLGDHQGATGDRRPLWPLSMGFTKLHPHGDGNEQVSRQNNGEGDFRQPAQHNECAPAATGKIQEKAGTPHRPAPISLSWYLIYL